MYVYCVEEVLEAADRFGLRSHLDSLVIRLQQGNPTLLEQLFDIRYPFWKRNLAGDSRLVGDLRWLGSVPVLVLFGLWGRGSHAYQDFLDRREETRYRNALRERVGDDDLLTWLGAQHTDSEQDVPPLPEELYEWTQFLHARNYRERLVLESGAWVEQIQALTEAQQHQVYQAVMELVDMELVDDVSGIRFEQLPQFHLEAAVRCWREGSVYVVVSLVQVSEREELFPFLVGVYDHEPSTQEKFVLGRATQLFGKGATAPDILQQPQPLEVWKQYARRAYPDYMVTDEKIWLEMQRSTEGNLALSMEEEAVLQQEAMPLLINGRAGSGKSLMLYYRFADYCSHYLKIGRLTAPAYQPLFLTYSQTLVQQAQDKVAKILRVSHIHCQDQQFSEADIQECQAFFSTFQQYLLDCLPPERQERYQPNQYVNFYQFRRRYPHVHSAERAWHTIRSLIKGYEVSGYLDPDGYRELPAMDRTVNDEEFTRIHEEIWPGYYELTTRDGYWDDQDLARDVLEHGTLKPIHPAIFVDEIQDFTHIELNIILCLSPWGNFRLDWQIQYLPYAFAGDPLQTINPTGFRWDALKQYLYDHIKAHQLPSHNFRPQDPQELCNNYRCNPRITRFSNVVNLWRQILSQGNQFQITPQRPWRPHEGGMPPQTFILGKNLTQVELKGMLRRSTGTVCILPCSVGEELDYIRKDPELKNIFAEELQENVKPAVLQTVTAVKGMEFKKIILYKFGDAYQKTFHRVLKDYAQGNAWDVPLGLGYFLNQLYVGITRPIEALAIVDTPAGKKQLWDPGLEISFWMQPLGQARSKWEDNPPLLDGAVSGMGIHYWRDENLGDVFRLAVDFLKRGVEERDPHIIRDAQVYARELGKPDFTTECQAWFFKVEGQYLEAAHQFLNIQESVLPTKNPKREAWECFWKGKAWSALQQHHDLFSGIPGIPDVAPLVNLMVWVEATGKKSLGKTGAAQLLQQVVQVRNWLNAKVVPKQWDATWRAGIEEFLNQLESVVNDLETFCPEAEERRHFLQETCKALAGHLAFLEQRQGLASQYHTILGTAYFYQKDFEEAVAAWDQGGKKEHSLYYQAKAELEPLPGKLKWLSKDGKDREVVRLWQEGGSPLTGLWQEEVKVVITSLERLQDWALLLRVLIESRNWQKLWQTVQSHPQAWRRGHDYALISTLARDPAANTAWDNPGPESFGLRAFVQEVLASVEAEHAWLPQSSVLELGLVYERLGHFQDTLKFYDRFTEAEKGTEVTMRQRSQIRQRWLYMYEKYQKFLKQEGRPTEHMAEKLKKTQDRWGEIIPEAEPPLRKRDPWNRHFVEHPSPVQQWLIQQEQTDAQARLKALIQQELEHLQTHDLERVYDQIKKLQRRP